MPRAKELIFTSRVLDGHQAYEMGVVNHAVEQNAAGTAAYERALELAEEILPQVQLMPDKRAHLDVLACSAGLMCWLVVLLL